MFRLELLTKSAYYLFIFFLQVHLCCVVIDMSDSSDDRNISGGEKPSWARLRRTLGEPQSQISTWTSIILKKGPFCLLLPLDWLIFHVMKVLGTMVVCLGIFCFPATIKFVLFFASPEQRAKVNFYFPVFLQIISYKFESAKLYKWQGLLRNDWSSHSLECLMSRFFLTLAQQEVTYRAAMVQT